MVKKQRVKRLVIKGNSKMGPLVGIWNLPPIRTCRPSPWCRANCYALRNNFLLPSVLESLRWRLEQSQRGDFVGRMIQETGRFKLFRIHSAGDFYSVKYVEAWMEIIAGCPKTKFRTTTRRTDLTKPLQRLHLLPNMIVRESLDHSKPTMNLPVAALTGTQMARGALRCINDCVTCGYRCWHRAVNVQFKKF